MKTILKSFLVFLGATITLSACSDWTDTEIKNPENLTDAQRTEEYYANLRAYKQTDHPIAFGWFGEWVGSGLSLEHSMRGLPDSVDVVSIWGNWKNLDAARIADKKYAKEVKGIRAMICFIVQSYGDQLTPSGEDRADFWLFGNYSESDDLDSVRVVNYANAICDTIDKYDYDGFDYDYEPNYGHSGDISKSSFSAKKYERIFVRTLAKRLGPLSGSGKLLVMDGEPQTIAGDLGECFDYFIVQAYACSGASNLDSRMAAAISDTACRRFQQVSLTRQPVLSQPLSYGRGSSEEVCRYGEFRELCFNRWCFVHRPQRKSYAEFGRNGTLVAYRERKDCSERWYRYLSYAA